MLGMGFLLQFIVKSVWLRVIEFIIPTDMTPVVAADVQSIKVKTYD